MVFPVPIKKKTGRPAVKRSEEVARRVKSYAAVGISQAEIARLFDLHEETLRKLYAQELSTAGAEATAKVAGKLFKLCMDENVTAIIFWMKTRGRWREAREDEGGGSRAADHAQMIRQEQRKLDAEAS